VVRAPADQSGDVIAELNRVGGWLRDFQTGHPDVLIRVSLPTTEVANVRGWLAKHIHGSAEIEQVHENGDA
jgi:hypothetical protein